MYRVQARDYFRKSYLTCSRYVSANCCWHGSIRAVLLAEVCEGISHAFKIDTDFEDGSVSVLSDFMG
jgi:hypothetical protein